MLVAFQKSYKVLGGLLVESISYTIDTFIIQLNQEDDDEIESARVDVERNNLTTWMLFRDWALVLWTLITKRQTPWASVAKQRKICKVQWKITKGFKCAKNNNLRNGIMVKWQLGVELALEKDF
ncbi:hypothetical protein NC652_027822 [Populus alba x Populus x berolinensis]|nr:hypothetical protein NC652_027822 [Populus alba x Populus x berolinensis]